MTVIHKTHFTIMTKLVMALLFSSFSLCAFAADDINSFISDSTFSGQLLYRFNNLDIADNPDASDSAAGGLFTLHTGAVKGVSFGATLATANDVFSDDSDYTYGVLKDDVNGRHQSFTAFKEYYVQGDWLDTTLKYGAQSIDTPWMGPNIYSYLVPITYKGVSISNTALENIELHAYYITDISDHAETWFKDITKYLKNVDTGQNLTSNTNNPLYIGGIKYTLPSEKYKAEAEGWAYRINDVINLNSVKGNAGTKFGDYYVGVIPSYVEMKSTGDALAGDFNTYQAALMMDLNAYGFDLVMAYGRNGDDTLVMSAGSLVQSQFLMGDRPKEKTRYGWLYYDFSAIDVNGLKAGITYADYNTPDSGAKASPDVTETDYNLLYDFGDSFMKGALKGLHVEVRYGVMNFENYPDMKELQFLTSYQFSFGGKKESDK